MVDFSNREDVKTWLDAIEPEERRREAAIVIAARAALRVLPLLGTALHDKSSKGYETLPNIVLPSLRATALPWAAGKYPARGNELRAATFAAATAARAADAATFAAAAATDAVIFAAAAAAAAADAADADAAIFAASTAASATAAYAAAAADAAATAAAAYAAAAADAAWLDGGRRAADLASASLWLGGAPGWATAAWSELRTAMLASHEDWRVWTDWYDARLAGAPANEDLEIARALIADEIWKQGPRAVNTEIARLIAAHRRPPDTPPPERLFDCFVSYATEDEAMAREVVGVLESAEYRTVTQFKVFDVGGNFVELMNRGLSRSGRVVALYSPHYQASAHCQAEWAYAYNLDPGGAGRKLVPFLIAPTALDPLARQVIYKSLVGLSRSRRRKAILEAFANKPPMEKAAEIQKALAQVASPQATLNAKRQIDAGANAIFDKPFVDDDLATLPSRQRGVADTIRGSLPPNSPPIVRNCLKSYALHLLEKGTQPIVGYLDDLAASLQAEFDSEDSADWGKGVAKLFERLLDNHELLRTHFPLKIDEVIAQFEIDEDKASGAALSEPIKKVDETAQEVLAVEGATPEFARAVSNSAAYAKDLASLPLRDSKDKSGGPRIGVKQRYVLGTIGFLVSIYNLVGTTATIHDSAAVAALTQAVAEAIEKFMAFLL